MDVMGLPHDGYTLPATHPSPAGGFIFHPQPTRGVNAYIVFKTEDSAQASMAHNMAVEAANSLVRKHKLKIRDRELRLYHALKANPTPSKQKESSTSKPAVGGNLSYQGIRATKSGGEKKFATRIAKHVRTVTRSENMVKKKVRSEKRPSVAARKAAANAARTGGDGGIKRKQESRTPQIHDGFCFVLLVPSAKLDAVLVQSDRVCPPCKKLKGENAPLYDSKRTVFIGNLPFDVK
nr:RNA-binding protein 34 [Tanacetum cinerariifolium]